MSRNAKIVLGIVGGLFAFCCCITVGAALLIPVAVQRVAESGVAEGIADGVDASETIVDYELPDGYSEQGNFSVFGLVKMVIIAPDNNQEMFIMLMQLPAGLPLDEETMRQQMEQTLIQQGWQQGSIDFEVVSTEQGEVNGESAVFTTLEGTDTNGAAVRQLTGIFTANDGGSAMVMIAGSVDGWDETAVNQFLASIRDDAGVGR